MSRLVNTFSAQAYKEVHTIHRLRTVTTRRAVNRAAVGSLAARTATTFLALLACPNFRDLEIAVAKYTHTPVVKREPWRLTPRRIRPTVRNHISYLKNHQEKACPQLA